MPTEEIWGAIRDGFVAGAEVVLGEDCHQQPDWFKESAPSLQPLISLRNSLFKRWLHSQCHWDRQQYIAMRRTVASAFKRAMIGSSGRHKKWKIRYAR